MLRFVIQKIRNKKWLNFCLLLGVVLIVSVFSCHPMIEKGAGNQVLQDNFETNTKNNQVFPSVISKKSNYGFDDNNRSLQSVYSKMESNEKQWCEALGIEKILSQKHVYISTDSTKTQYSDRIQFFNVGVLQDMDSHIQIVKGESLQSATVEKNVFPCIISEQTMDSTNLVVGERIKIYSKNGKQNISNQENNNQENNNQEEQIGKENQIEFVVVGICKEKYNADNFWHSSLSEFYKTLFVTDETFDELVSSYGVDEVSYEQNILLNYKQIDYDNAKSCITGIEKIIATDEDITINFYDTLTNFQNEKKTIRILLWALELPCIVLLMLFIYMVSTQIINSEENEIAALRSRGVSVRQIITLYFLHSLILSLVGTVLGVLLGFLMCKCAASTNAFLTFVNKDLSNYAFTWDMLLYAGVACIIVIIFMTVPVWKRADITIVNRKSSENVTVQKIRKTNRRNKNKIFIENVSDNYFWKPFWEKSFLDVILLGVSIYLLYNYQKQLDGLAESIINKKSIDPMIFLVSSLFIFACSLIFVRLLKCFVNAIDGIGKKYWGPAMYVSFLHIKRNFYKQGFLCMFLIMTIATGIFNSNMARTINANNEARINYNIGADARLLENWKLFTKIDGDKIEWRYEEKSFDAFYEIEKEGLCERVTKVITDEKATVRADNTDLDNCLLMGINTKEFGETARLKDGLNDTHWYNSLNALAVDVDGAIISRNTADALDIGVGDYLKLIRYSPISTEEPEKMGTVELKVSAVVDCFPGYEQYTYIEDDSGRIVEKENYLIVANYAMLISSFEHTPYNVWMRMSEDTSSEDLVTYLEENSVQIEQMDIAGDLIEKNRNSAMVQITNGMFTMSFLISLIICAVGFMIYWIMSIKNRQMVFGVYRAMGMRMKEVYVMLLNEHFFSSILSIVTGGAVGVLATLLFVKLITIVYLPQKHNIDVEVFIYGMDMVKLFGIIMAVVVVCFMILQRTIRKLRIEQALKM